MCKTLSQALLPTIRSTENTAAWLPGAKRLQEFAQEHLQSGYSDEHRRACPAPPPGDCPAPAFMCPDRARELASGAGRLTGEPRGVRGNRRRSDKQSDPLAMAWAPDHPATCDSLKSLERLADPRI